jgi:UDP-N-acetylmuramyl pentapeptide phosphotransferase/UDP-N-acetylglucosamine-1-phosphate transferase
MTILRRSYPINEVLRENNSRLHVHLNLSGVRMFRWRVRVFCWLLSAIAVVLPIPVAVEYDTEDR